MSNLALKKTKEILTSCCLVALSLSFATAAYAIGARGEFTCYDSFSMYSIETRMDHCTEEQAAQVLYNDACNFCSDKGGLANFRVNSFGSAEKIKLSGTSWEVTSYNDGRGLVDINFYKELDIQFGADGRFWGRSFCNNYMGDYTVSGDRISMKAGSSTYMRCEERRMRQDDLLLEAFRAAVGYETKGDQLILKDDYGTWVVVLIRK
ncbi:MAG: META domain-containing protein [Candidatus Electrothrix aestuarii]|uniref:META domain-containing protein n=1 Tax=Candidatus Electrothrix aestuarii TaxID=3062594 RepID=A0AAU8LYT9_9BACT|nr:META domain-containing protein [Candidatus Electrothrix aestuarii]